MNEIKPGMVVAYAHKFLRSIGTEPTSELWRQRGEVVSVNNGFARVRWEDDPEPMAVRVSNLAVPGPNIGFCG